MRSSLSTILSLLNHPEGGKENYKEIITSLTLRSDPPTTVPYPSPFSSSHSFLLA